MSISVRRIIANGDIQQYLALLRRDAFNTLLQVDAENRNALWWLARYNRVDMLRLAMDQHLELVRTGINWQDTVSNYTPLHVAITQTGALLALVFLEGVKTSAYPSSWSVGARPDLSLVDTDDNTVLHSAIIHNKIGLIRVLIAHGCPVDALNIFRQSALTLSIQVDRIDAVVLLLRCECTFPMETFGLAITVNATRVVYFLTLHVIGGAHEAENFLHQHAFFGFNAPQTLTSDNINRLKRVIELGIAARSGRRKVLQKILSDVSMLCPELIARIAAFAV